MQLEAVEVVLIFVGALVITIIPLLIWSSRSGKKRMAELAKKAAAAAEVERNRISDLKKAHGEMVRGLVTEGKIFEYHANKLFEQIESNPDKALIAIDSAIALKSNYERLKGLYGDEAAVKIMNEEYFIGMTEQMLIESKGNPDKIETEQMKTKTKNTWVYGNKSSGDIFYFENGVLTKFKDR